MAPSVRAIFVSLAVFCPLLTSAQNYEACSAYEQAYQEVYNPVTARSGSVNFCARPEYQVAEPAGGCVTVVTTSNIHHEDAYMAPGIRICTIRFIEDKEYLQDATIIEGDLRCAVPWNAKFVKLKDGTYACAKIEEAKPALISMLF